MGWKPMGGTVETAVLRIASPTMSVSETLFRALVMSRGDEMGLKTRLQPAVFAKYFVFFQRTLPYCTKCSADCDVLYPKSDFCVVIFGILFYLLR